MLDKIILLKPETHKIITVLCFAYATGYRYQIKAKRFYNFNSSIKTSLLLNRLKNRGFQIVENKDLIK